MPYPFKLPTTALLALQTCFSSTTHPSLPVAATTSRSLVRNALKKHKRLRNPAQTLHLSDVLAALNNYIPFLLAVDAGLGGRELAGEEVDIVLEQEIIVQWRPVLTASLPGREPSRISLRSLEYEIFFTLSTVASTYCLIARNHLIVLYNAVTPTAEQRTTAISTALKYFLEAHSIYAYILSRVGQISTLPPAPDVAPSTFSVLASLTLAEATLLAVFKDDPYPAAVTQDRNKHDKEWMYKPPEMSSVRASLFARLCIAAADHASIASGMIGHSTKIVDNLPRYIDGLRRTAKAKACRFLGIDAELAGKTGEGIAWLHAAQRELGLSSTRADEEKLSRGLGKLRKDWAEKREDRKTEKGAEWGSDAGKFEEGRVIEMLLGKWTKMNSIMTVQAVPPADALLAKMPSGREFHSPKPWTPPTLDTAVLARMRAPPSPTGGRSQFDEDDSEDDERMPSAPAGAFPGTEGRYSSGSSYY